MNGVAMLLALVRHCLPFITQQAVRMGQLILVCGSFCPLHRMPLLLPWLPNGYAATVSFLPPIHRLN